MFYVCTCGFDATTATAFYKHLAKSKDSGVSHQLVQAKFTDKAGRGQKSAKENQAAVPQAESRQELPSSGSLSSLSLTSKQQPMSWVDEYLVVDGSARRSAAVDASGLSATAGPQPLDAVSPGSIRMVEQAARQVLDEPAPSEQSPKLHRPSTSGARAQALRVSSNVMSAVVTGLSPWRWFGQPPAEPAAAAEGPGPGPGTLDASSGDAAEHMGMAPDCNLPDLAMPPPAEETLVPRPYAASEAGQVATPSGDPLVAVAQLEAVLTWQNPWRSARVFGAGLYAIICLQQFSRGHELLQPSTALFAGTFMYLLRNLIRNAYHNYQKQQQHQQQQQQEPQDLDDGVLPTSTMNADSLAKADDLKLMHRAEVALQRLALGAARYAAAAVVLLARLLSGRHAITSALVAALLWLGMVLGELRVMSQPAFWMLAYVGVFTIPAAYVRCRQAMDSSVEEALRFVTRVLLAGSRTSLLAAAGVAGALLAALPMHIVLRATLALIGGFVVLLWYARDVARAQGQACTQQQQQQLGASEQADASMLSTMAAAAATAGADMFRYQAAGGGREVHG